MEVTGLDPYAQWPMGMLEWVWERPGVYLEVQMCARWCVSEVGVAWDDLRRGAGVEDWRWEDELDTNFYLYSVEEVSLFR
jgi:hypothetical protein